MGLGIQVNVKLLPEGSEVAAAATARSKKDSGYLMRLCHPELSKSGVCATCASFWFVVFDPKTMQAVDGGGNVLPVGWHEHCVCEDVPAELAMDLEIEPKNINQELGAMLKKDIDSVGGLNKTQKELIDAGAIDVNDLFNVKSAGGIKETRTLNQLIEDLAYRPKKDLLGILSKEFSVQGDVIEKIAKFKNKEISGLIIELTKSKPGISKKILSESGIQKSILSIGKKLK